MNVYNRMMLAGLGSIACGCLLLFLFDQSFFKAVGAIFIASTFFALLLAIFMTQTK